jgi:hypothetical protein
MSVSGTQFALTMLDQKGLVVSASTSAVTGGTTSTGLGARMERGLSG